MHPFVATLILIGGNLALLAALGLLRLTAGH